MGVLRIGLLSVVGVSLAALCACDDIGAFGHVEQDFHYSYTMQPGGRLDIENRNGSITILGWDRNSIDVSGTKYAPDNPSLQEVQIKVDVNGNVASIMTESPRDSWGSFGAKYTIHLPANTTVSRAKSTNGSVSADDLNAGGSLITTNGKITLQRDNGNFELRTTNGSIELEDCSGIERVETTNGGVHGLLKAGALEARTTNGSIEFAISKPQPSGELRAETTNGSVHLSLSEFASNPIRVETTHGSITLRLPHDTNARIDARTSLAHISSELPISAEESDRHNLRGQLGNGGPVISATTTTGAIRIEDAGR